MAGHIPYDIIPSNNTKANEARIQGVISDSFMNQVQNGIPIPANDPNSQLLDHVARIRRNTDIDILLKTIGLNFQGFNVALLTGVVSPITQVSKFPRGYIIINPASFSGGSTTLTFFTSGARAAGAFTSSVINVSAVDSLRVWLDITANALPHTLTVDAQTQDPNSGNWATSQLDIFSGAAAVGTYYADLGSLGVDQNIRFLATVGAGAGTMTFSMSGLAKGGGTQPIGTTVFVGGPDVNSTTGYPLLPSQKEYFYLLDNVQLFAMNPLNDISIKVFQLQ